MAGGFSVGNGYGVGDIGNPADRYGAIQQGLAHKFDSYTNPFLLAQNISGVFQPGIQNAQRQQGLGIEQQNTDVAKAREQLAETAQNTLLPLQAQQLSTQTDYLRGQAALQSFNLDKTRDAYGQMPGLLQGVSEASAKGDLSGVFSAAAQNPAAAMTNPAIFNDAVNRISQQQAVVTGGLNASAMAKGADYASQHPEATSDELALSYTPSDGLSPAQQQIERNSYIQGGAHQQVQMTTAKNLGQIKIAAAEMRMKGQIDAATQKALSPLVAKGLFTPEAMTAAGIDPDTADKLMASINSSPNAQGAVVPDKVAVANIGAAKSILAGLNPSTTEKSWAYGVMNSGGAAPFQLPIYTPQTQDQIDLLNTQIGEKATTLKELQKSPNWNASSIKTEQKDLNDLRQKLINVKNSGAVNQQPAGGFGYNPFNPYGITAPNGSAALAPAVAGGDKGESSSQSVQTAPATQPKAAAPDVSKLAPKDQSAYQWAISHPTDPRSKQILEHIKSALSQSP